jgi:hypothetical protein
VIVQVKDAIANPTTNTTTHEAAVRVAKAVCTGTGTLCFLVQVSRAMEAVGCRGVGIPAGDQRGRETAIGVMLGRSKRPASSYSMRKCRLLFVINSVISVRVVEVRVLK